jgi:hypothetical protein
MKNAGKTVIVAVAFVAGILLVEAIKPSRLREPTAADVKVQIDKLKAEAAQKHPGMAQSDAIKQVATAQATEMLKTGDAETRAKTAAGLFFGSYFMNTRARPAYCKQRGVDLAPFVAAFNQAHREELTRARDIFSRGGIDPESMVPKIQEQFVAMVDQDMKDFAAGAKVQPESACDLFNQNSKLIAEAIQLPPEVKQTLMATY